MVLAIVPREFSNLAHVSHSSIRIALIPASAARFAVRHILLMIA
jgi:hypothetical protein